MFRDDLKDAGIAYRDDTGRVADFHSLRVTFCTLLAAAGVPVKTLQTLARHSSPVLTLNTYTRTAHGSLADAVQRLPDFGHPSREAARATGTDCVQVPTGGRTGVQTGGNAAQTGSIGCSDVLHSGREKTPKTRRKTAILSELTCTVANGGVMTPTGVEPVLPA